MLQARPVVLCVDDEPSNLRLLERTLTPHGYAVLKAADGKEALDCICSGKVDLVIMDVLMPEIDGFEVCRRIKSDERYRQIPVVMITALGSKGDRIRGIEEGADEFLVKPFDHAEILARVKMLLRTKELNEMLNDSYANILNITAIGGQIITSFNPAAFALLPHIDSLAERIVRRDGDVAGKPALVLVCIGNRGAHEWYRYECIDGCVLRSSVELAMPLPAVPAGGITAAAHNAPGALPELRVFMDSLQALNMGVENMVSCLSDMVGVFALNYGREVLRYDAAVLESLAMQTLFFMRIAAQIRENEDAFAYTVHSLARAAEANDEDTGNHILRVGEYCAILAEALDLGAEFVNSIRLQAVLHDVGKVHIPMEILKKPCKLDPQEMELMKSHPVTGAKIIGDHPRFDTARLIALTHHERWDGSGYPCGHAGERIPLAGRIMNMADQYDALRNWRVYKPAIDHETTMRIIIEGDGRTLPCHFDPVVFTAFKKSAPLFEEVYASLQG